MNKNTLGTNFVHDSRNPKPALHFISSLFHLGPKGDLIQVTVIEVHVLMAAEGRGKK